MIITHETNDVGNVIRVITGIESDVMLKIHGVMVLDITPILGQFDQSKPVFLSIGKVDSETQTIGMMHAVNAKPPFFAPLAVIDNNIKVKEDKVKEVKESKPKSDHKVKLTEGKCHLCGGKESLINVDNERGICPSCFKINAGLNKKKVKTNGSKVRPV